MIFSFKFYQINSKIKEQNNTKKIGIVQTPNKINDENIFSYMAQNMFIYLKNESNENPNNFKIENKLETNNWDNDNKTLKFEKEKSYNETSKNKNKEIIYKKNRTALKEEITIHNNFSTRVPNYFDRKNFDLMRIVEDQVILLIIKLILKFFGKNNFIF